MPTLSMNFPIVHDGKRYEIGSHVLDKAVADAILAANGNTVTVLDDASPAPEAPAAPAQPPTDPPPSDGA